VNLPGLLELYSYIHVYIFLTFYHICSHFVTTVRKKYSLSYGVWSWTLSSQLLKDYWRIHETYVGKHKQYQYDPVCTMYTNYRYYRVQELNLSCQQHLHAFVQAVELDPHVKELPQARAHWTRSLKKGTTKHLIKSMQTLDFPKLNWWSWLWGTGSSDPNCKRKCL
jgi:hypothetical protein